MHWKTLALALSIVLAPQLAWAQDNQPEGLSLEAAAARVLEHNPDLAGYPFEVRAAEARQIQAGLRPNPELSLEAEDIGIGNEGAKTRSWSVGPGATFETARENESGHRSGLREAEFTVSLSQLIELGGKRAQRIAAASAERQVALWDYEVARADVLAETAQRFVETLAAQERLALARQLLGLAEQVEVTTAGRVEAGRISPLELNRAQMEVARARSEVAQVEKTLEAARTRLSALWGEPTPAFGAVQGQLSVPAPPPLPEDLAQRISSSPDLKRWLAEIELRHKLVDLESARRTPDITATAGWRVLGQADSATRGFGLGSEGLSWSHGRTSPDSDYTHSLVAGVSIPLPLFDRNQGSIEESRQRAAQAEAQMQSASVTAQAEIKALSQSMAGQYTRFTTSQNELLPKAQETFEGIQEGYRQGKFALIDVLDAQRTLFEVQRDLLESTEQYWTTRIAMERLMGEQIDYLKE